MYIYVNVFCSPSQHFITCEWLSWPQKFQWIAKTKLSVMVHSSSKKFHYNPIFPSTLHNMEWKWFLSLISYSSVYPNILFPNSASWFTMSNIHHPGIMFSIGSSRVRLAPVWFDWLLPGSTCFEEDTRDRPKPADEIRSQSKPSGSSQSSGIVYRGLRSWLLRIPCAVYSAVCNIN